MSINDIQDEIISEFSLLDGDMEMTILYIMELGQKLAPIKDSDRVEDNVVKGCQSTVWLVGHEEDGRVYFEADSKHCYH